MVTSTLVADLRTIVGDDLIVGDRQAMAPFAQDHNRYYEPQAQAVIFPRSVEQVQQLVHVAIKHACPLVPSGGRTGLSGGATATAREVVVAFDRMNRIGHFSAVDRVVSCEPGVITEDLQRFALGQGLCYPVDFASSGSSQIGGNIATNAGGIKVIRYGMTRDWVAGLTVVTGKGEVLQLNRGLVKNATGYDLRHLFVGAEGTLGLIVEAQMRLTDPMRNPNVMLMGVPSVEALMHVASHFRAGLSVTAFEFFCHEGLQRVLARSGRAHPFGEHTAYYALLEFEAPNTEDEERALGLFEAAAENGWVEDAVLAQSQQQASDLWALRENMSETLSHFMPYKNDLSVRVERVPEFMHAVETLVNSNYPDFDVVWFGHIGDGNLHLNILKPENLAPEAFKARCEVVNREVFAVVRDLEGSISAEHGVGLQKRDFLHYSRTAEEIALMRSIKAVFDPHGIMNPGKLI